VVFSGRIDVPAFGAATGPGVGSPEAGLILAKVISSGLMTLVF